MSEENATRCDVVGCKAKVFETYVDFVSKGWIHAVITTRAGQVTIDLCETHSRPLGELLASVLPELHARHTAR